MYVAKVESAEWRLRSSVGLSETYTDNVRLASPGLEQADWVTELSPSIGITAQSARLQLQADYAFIYRWYANNDQANGHNDALKASGLLDVWDKKLFLQGAASVTQKNISTLGAITASNVNLTPDRTEVRQASLNPHWISRLGSFASLRAGLTMSRAESDGATRVLNTDSRGAQASVSSGPAFSDFGWNVAYSNTQIESTGGQFAEREIENLTVSLRYRLWPSLAALLTTGRDDNTFGNARGSTGGGFYTVGLEWIPGPRTKVSAQVGERYYGKTAAVDMSHRTRLTSWQLEYSEQIVATPGLFSLPMSVDTFTTVDRLFSSQFPDTVERQQIVQAYIALNGLPSSLTTAVDFLTNRVSLAKRLQGVFGLRGTRGSLLLTAYHLDRESQSSDVPTVATDPFLLSNSTVQSGFSGILSWRFTEFTSGSASLAHQQTKLAAAGRIDKDNTLRLGVTHKLGPRLSASMEYRLLDRDSTAVRSDIRENAVVGTVTMSF